jgi:hypothetical protein
MRNSRIAGAVVLTVLMSLSPMGCSKPQGNVKEVKVDAIGKPAEDPWKSSKAPEQEKARFKKQVAEQAEFFAKQSNSAYASGKKPEDKSIWAKLWPWGRKKEDEKPKFNVKEFKFSAEYPNQHK